MRRQMPWSMAWTAIVLAGCASNFTPMQRMQDAANDLTTAVRFGRMDMAIERVSRGNRDQFTRQHATWGNAVRIVDCDLSGVRLENKDHAEVTLVVSWHRIDESDMRSTRIAQRWRDDKGRWLLESEERAAGDFGLLGETTTVVRPDPARVQFETITIR